MNWLRKNWFKLSFIILSFYFLFLLPQLTESTRLKDILETISYGAQGALVFIGILALGQISIAKNDMRVRTERESKKEALNQSVNYAEKIIPAMEAYHNK